MKPAKKSPALCSTIIACMIFATGIILLNSTATRAETSPKNYDMKITTVDRVTFAVLSPINLDKDDIKKLEKRLKSLFPKQVYSSIKYNKNHHHISMLVRCTLKEKAIINAANKVDVKLKFIKREVVEKIFE